MFLGYIGIGVVGVLGCRDFGVYGDLIILIYPKPYSLVVEC